MPIYYAQYNFNYDSYLCTTYINDDRDSLTSQLNYYTPKTHNWNNWLKETWNPIVNNKIKKVKAQPSPNGKSYLVIIDTDELTSVEYVQLQGVLDQTFRFNKPQDLTKILPDLTDKSTPYEVFKYLIHVNAPESQSQLKKVSESEFKQNINQLVNNYYQNFQNWNPLDFPYYYVATVSYYYDDPNDACTYINKNKFVGKKYRMQVMQIAANQFLVVYGLNKPIAQTQQIELRQRIENQCVNNERVQSRYGFKNDLKTIGVYYKNQIQTLYQKLAHQNQQKLISQYLNK